MAAQDSHYPHDSRPQTLYELLTFEEMQVLSTAVETVMIGPGFGIVSLDIRRGRVYLVETKTTVRPGINGGGDQTDMENLA